MSGVAYFIYLVRDVYVNPIAAVLAAGSIVAFAATKCDSIGSRLRLFLLGCLPPFAMPMAILVVGVVYVSKPPWVTGVEAPAFPGYIIEALTLAHFPLAALMIWWWGKRWPAIAVSWACAGVLSLAAGFISSMSVTGIWL